MATSLRDFAQQAGLGVGYDEKTKKVTLGSKSLAPNQIEALGGQLINGSWQFNDTSKLGTLTGQPVVKTVAPTATPTPTFVTPAVQTPSIADYQRQLMEAERAKTMASLKGAYDKTLGAITEREAQVPVEQEAIRSGIRTRGQMDAQRFAEFLAQRGLSTSGVAPQGFLQQAGQVQSGLTASQLAQQAELDRLGRQRLQAEKEYQTGLAGAEANMNIANLNQMIESQREAEQLARQQATQAETQARSDFGATIMANYNDLQGFANRLQAQGAPQWQIDQVLAARQQKIAEQGLDQQGRPIPVDNSATINEMIWNRAMDKWNSGIPLTQEEMQVIGSPTAVKPKAPTGGTSSNKMMDDMLTRWKAFGVADQTVASYFNIPVGSKYGAVSFTTPAPTPSYNAPIPTREDFLANIANKSLTEKSDYIARLIMNGTFDALEQSNPDLYNEFDRIAMNQGVTDASIAQALARLGVSSTSQGVGNTQNIR